MGSEVFNLIKPRPLELTLLVRLTSGPVTFELLPAVDIIGTGLSLRLANDFLFRNNLRVKMNERDLFSSEPACFCPNNSVDAANDKLPRPKTMLG